MNSGTSFDRAYNMGSWSGAVCVASRHMLNTGRFIWQAQKASNCAEDERIEGRWWSEYMKNAGYKTYMTGKWHVRAKAEESFDVVRNVRGGMPNQTPKDIIAHFLTNLTHGVPMIENSKDFGRGETLERNYCRRTHCSFLKRLGISK